MNWLAHLRLASGPPLVRLGNLCGDFVRGADLAALHPELQRGIVQHRAIDRYVDAHPLVRQSRARVPAPWQRFSGALCDLFFDHFLARDWAAHGGGQPLAQFAAGTYAALEAHAPLLPPRLQAALPFLRQEDWLGCYASLDGIDAILQRMARRSERRQPLASAGAALRADYAGFAADFAALWPDLLAAAPRLTAAAVDRE